MYIVTNNQKWKRASIIFSLVFFFFLLESKTKILIKKKIQWSESVCVWVSASFCPTLVKETTIFMWGSVIIYRVCVCFKWRAREIYSRCLYSRLLYGVSSIISTVAVHRTSPLSCSTALQLCLWSVTPRWHNIQHTGVLWTNTSKQVAKQKNPDFAFKRGEKNREMD